MIPGNYAESDPDRPAVVTGDGTVVTYQQLETRSCRLARGLARLGLGAGDHVAVLLPNDERTHEVAWGLHRSGLYYTFVNTHLTADEAAYIINDCDARVLITSDKLTGLARALLPLTPAIEHRIALGRVDGYRGYVEVVEGMEGVPLADEREGSPMLYSSGTTGRPKGVRRPLTGAPFGAPHPMTSMLQHLMGFQEGDVYLSPAPLYHSAPLVWSMSAMRLGGTVVLMERFDAEECLRLIGRHRVTHAQFVPTMFVRMLKLPREARERSELGSLRAVVHAAAPCPVEVKQRMIDWWGPIVHEYYSGTEGGGMTWITSEQWLSHPGSVGPAIWGRVHICDDQGRPLPAGQAGVVWFGGRDNTFEYHHDQEKTSGTFNERGWSTLWDVGYLDDDDYLYLTDRKTHMIVSGGVNIYPREVEDVLILHPEVADVAVFGVPDPEMGEQVKAVVQPAAGLPPEPDLGDRLIEHCRGNLARFKCPRSIDFVETVPRGENGKLYTRLLRDPYWVDSPPISTGGSP